MSMQVKIAHRETEEYAMRQPDIVRVSIKDGKILSDNREKYFGHYYVYLNIRKEVKHKWG